MNRSKKVRRRFKTCSFLSPWPPLAEKRVVAGRMLVIAVPASPGGEDDHSDIAGRPGRWAPGIPLAAAIGHETAYASAA
jgi:hypothetical protein